MQRKQIVVTALVAALLNVGFLAGAALGGQKWNAEHPRRAEVNHRLHNQNARIKEGLKTGKLSANRPKHCTSKTSRFARRTHRRGPERRSYYEERAEAAQPTGKRPERADLRREAPRRPVAPARHAEIIARSSPYLGGTSNSARGPELHRVRCSCFRCL